jgi:hypothetical protein
LYGQKYVSLYSFIRNSTAIKIAFPQDDYDHSAILDDCLDEWRVDFVHSPCAAHADVLYPKTRRHAEIVPALTGYIDDADVDFMSRIAKPFGDRAIDIGYRAADLPPQFGRFGRQKADIARHIVTHLASSGLRLDISTAPEAMIQGDRWFDFLANCRFTLGCESGSSINDPYGRISDCINRYAELNHTASFEEFEQNCFAGQDGLACPGGRVFSTISPRIFEAALAGTTQILIEGEYGGLLEPSVHYVPVDATVSHADKLIDIVRDQQGAERMSAACKARLLSLPQLTYRNLVSSIFEKVNRSLPRPDSARIAKADCAQCSAEQMHKAAWDGYLASVEGLSKIPSGLGGLFSPMRKVWRVVKLIVAYSIDYRREAGIAGTAVVPAWTSGISRAIRTTIALLSKRFSQRTR